MEVTLYQATFTGSPDGFLSLSLEPQNPHGSYRVGPVGREAVYPADTSVSWLITVPDDATVERDPHNSLMVLTWNLGSAKRTSLPHEVFALAQLGIHGFGNVRRAE